MVNRCRLRAQGAEKRLGKGVAMRHPSLSGRDRVRMDTAAERRDHIHRRWWLLDRLRGLLDLTQNQLATKGVPNSIPQRLEIVCEMDDARNGCKRNLLWLYEWRSTRGSRQTTKGKTPRTSFGSCGNGADAWAIRSCANTSSTRTAGRASNSGSSLMRCSRAPRDASSIYCSYGRSTASAARA